MPDQAQTQPRAVKAFLVAGGKYHDINFARLEILKLLGEHPEIRVDVDSDYRRIEDIEKADFLITYTCDVTPPEDIQKRLRDWVRAGGRWFALHGTNSILRFTAEGKVNSPREAPVLMETLGSQFIAHPPIGPYKVHISDPDHPLVKGVPEFETSDELYQSVYHGDLKELLHCFNTGPGTGFIEDDWPVGQKHLVMYMKPQGQGCVTYLTLGHCRGHHDMAPLMDYYPVVERGSWELPEFYELLRRGITWAKTGAP